MDELRNGEDNKEKFFNDYFTFFVLLFYERA